MQFIYVCVCVCVCVCVDYCVTDSRSYKIDEYPTKCVSLLVNLLNSFVLWYPPTW